MSATELNTLFVYGSLKRTYQHAMHEHINRFADFKSEGFFQGKLYKIDWYPGLIESEYPEDRVFGEIYEMHNPGNLLPLLDQFEGFSPSKPQDGEYVRCIKPVFTATDDTVDCQVYLYNWPIQKAQRIFSGVF